MPFTPVDIRPGRVRERTGRKTDGIPVRHYPYLMPVRRGRKGYSTVAVKKQCVVGRLNAVPCNRREYHVSIPVYTLRLPAISRVPEDGAYIFPTITSPPK